MTPIQRLRSLLEEEVSSDSISKWKDEFIGALKKWKGAKDFLKSGGVPGCVIPSGMSFEELADWWVKGPQKGSVYDAPFSSQKGIKDFSLKQLVSNHGKLTVEDMIDADNSYSPDY
jgi:hypothetical protein